MRKYKKEKELLVFGIIFLIVGGLLFSIHPNNALTYLQVRMTRDLLILLGFIFSTVGLGIIIWKRTKNK